MFSRNLLAVLPRLNWLRTVSLMWLTSIFAGAAGCSRESHETRAVSSAQDTAARMGNSRAGNSAFTANRDYRTVAQKVVAQSARVREGDLVWIGGTDEDLPLLEDLAIEVRKLGGDPVVTVSTVGFNRRSYDEVPANYDTVAPRAIMKMAGVFDVFIATESFEEGALKGVPPERIAARTEAYNQVQAVMHKRGVRRVLLGNGLYPTAERAGQLDIPRQELAEMLYGGIDIDYNQLQRVGEEVRRIVARGKDVRITAANGTDLRLRVAGRPVYTSDGIISSDDERQGGAATIVWLPAGDVYFTPVPGSAEGVVTSARTFFRGEPVDGLRLEFKNGKLVNMTAKSGLKGLEGEYRTAGEGKDMFGAVDFGINPNVKVPADKPIHVWSRAGMVTIGVGNNLWAGGNNDVGFGFGAYLPNATVTVDGHVVIEDGELPAARQVAHQ